MQKRRRPHAVAPKSQPGAADAWDRARDAGASQPMPLETVSDRLELAVIEMQIDNIHLELDAQLYRTAQLETLLVGIKDELHELIDLVKWLQHEVLNRPASAEGTERTVLH
jgi:hypothetical protein